MKHLRVVQIAIVVALTLVHCTRGKEEQAVATDATSRVENAAYVASVPPPTAPSPMEGSLSGQMIIRNGELAISVENAEKSLTAIRSIAKRHDAFIADSRVWRVESQHRASIVIRVPASKLDALIAELKQVATRIENENLTGQDVTAEYVDLGARLRNLEAAEVELRELLRTVRQQAKKAADILEVYRELTTIRGEIEQVKGRMQYLQEHAAMATLRVELMPDVMGTPVAKSGWRPLATMKEASRALIASAQRVADGAIWLLLYVIPILAILALPVVIILRIRRTTIAS